MRVALVDPSLFTWPYDSALALALADAGHEVRIFGKRLSAADAGPGHELLHPHFYKRLPLSAPPGFRRKLFLAQKGVSHAFSMRTLVGELRRFRPDVIHFQWTPLPLVDRVFLPKLRTIAPLVLTVHDSNPFNGNPRASLQALGAVSIMARFDRLIVHTEQAASRLRNYGVDEARIRIVPHGPLDQSVGQPEEASSGPARSTGERPVEVLLFGRLKHYKGADLLLQAAAQMDPALRARCLIRIVGEPFIDLEPLRRIVAEAGMEAQVRIEPDFVPEEEVDRILRSADILAFPYREIDASGVLMKSLASGAPMIASRLGLFAELLVDGKHGRLVAPEDVAGLARALEELVSDGELRARMGREVRRLRDEIPQWPAIGETTARLYGELVATPAASAAEGA